MGVHSIPQFLIFVLLPISVIAAPTNDFRTDEQENITRGLTRSAKPWPSGNVYYKFLSGVGDLTKTTVVQAMREIEKSVESVVQFKEDPGRKDGVVEVSEERRGYSCIATLGYRPQGELFLVVQFKTTRLDCGGDSKLSPVGIAVHELMHILGYHHEFERNDRDKYIRFNKDAVIAYYKAHGYGKYINDQNWRQFTGRQSNDDTKGLPFNFKSVTNYDISSQVTVLENPSPKPIGNVKNFGQICYISAGDRNLIEKTYYMEKRGKDAKLKKYTSDYRLPDYGKPGCRDMQPAIDEADEMIMTESTRNA